MAHKNFIHKYNELKNEIVEKRVNEMISTRENLIAQGTENLHVKFSFGNRKTGALVPSVSLIPVEDCPNCNVCKNGCYDVRNVCFQKTVKNSRANNSAILHTDPEKYFNEITKQCTFLSFFRWHVGGDLVNKSYFLHVIEVAKNTPNCKHLLFTKLYGVINKYMDNGGTIPENLQVIFSDWRGVKFDNRYNFPVSSPVWYNADHEEIERGPHTTNICYWCPGDCSQCAENKSGCWTLKQGETILFEAH